MIGGGGEEQFIRQLVSDPPANVDYSLAIAPHESVPGARCRRLTEIGFNRLVHPAVWPIQGLRAYEVDDVFDLVHVHVHPHHLRLSKRTPVLMTLSNSYYHYIQDYLHWEPARVRALYARAQRIFGVFRITNEFVSSDRLTGMSVFSDFAKSVLVSWGVPSDRVVVIPPGFDTPPLRPRDRASREYTFLFAGRDPDRKGADLVIEGVRRLRRQGQRVRAILAGDETFLELAGEPGFEVYSSVPRHRLLDDLYPRADAFVMPSRAEGYGFTLVEAMAHGLPVISSTYGSIPEVVADGRTGVLVPPGDGDAVVEAMRTLAGDPDSADAMGLAGRHRFERDFTRDRFLERMRSWYDHALAET